MKGRKAQWTWVVGRTRRAHSSASLPAFCSLAPKLGYLPIHPRQAQTLGPALWDPPANAAKRQASSQINKTMNMTIRLPFVACRPWPPHPSSPPRAGPRGRSRGEGRNVWPTILMRSARLRTKTMSMSSLEDRRRASLATVDLPVHNNNNNNDNSNTTIYDHINNNDIAYTTKHNTT